MRGSARVRVLGDGYLRFKTLAAVVAVGVAAATLATMFHETLGHVLGCRLANGNVALLTSILFRCSVNSLLSDLAGPLGNLVGGLIGAFFLSKGPKAGGTRLFFLHFTGISLFWFAGQLAHDAALERDDWAFLGQAGMWRTSAIAAGVLLYWVILKMCRVWIEESDPTVRRTLPTAYLAGALSAAAAGLVWPPAPFVGAREALLAVGVAPLGLLAALMTASAGAPVAKLPPPIRRPWAWIIISTAFFASFVLLQARGVGPLATTAFHR